VLHFAAATGSATCNRCAAASTNSLSALVLSARACGASVATNAINPPTNDASTAVVRLEGPSMLNPLMRYCA
jgi:ribosomal protein L37AE/L43A